MYGDKSNLPSESLDTAILSIAHRGPDSSGQFRSEDLLLGHLRLSIVDVENDLANQPFVDPISGSVLVFNGEIYNYLDLRKQHLKHRQFISNSDTEVLLYLLVDFGLEATLKLINGMFAFGFFDKKLDKLFLARDIVGKKPLFYCSAKGVLRFASESRALFKLGAENQISEKAVVNFICERTVGSWNQSFYKDIFNVKAGHYLKIENGDDGISLSEHQYWEPPVELLLDINDGVKKFDELLRKGIERRIPAEVPFAIMLSGGLDSSALACLAAELNPNLDIPVISAIYPGAAGDESKFAIECIEKYPNLKPHFIDLRSEKIDFLDELNSTIISQESPIADGSMIAHNLLMRHISSLGIKVVLSGNGADELFGGYTNTSVPMVYSRHLKSYIFGRKTTTRSKLLFHLIPDWLKNLAVRIKHIRQGFIKQTSYYGLLNSRYPKLNMANRASKYAFLSIRHWNSPGFVWYEDRNSMAYSIEARSPFYDKDLMDFAFTLAPSLLVRDELGKVLLRKSMRGIIPDSILDRKKKQGFHAPIESWLESAGIDPRLDDTFRLEFDYLNIDKIFSNDLTSRWRLTTLYQWYKLSKHYD